MSFVTALRAGRSGVPKSLVPATPQMLFGSDVILRRLAEPTAHLQVGHRLDLDLAAATARGIIVELPLLTARCADADTDDRCDSVEAASAVHLYLRRVDYLRASELSCGASQPPIAGSACTVTPLPCDPSAGDAAAATWLPRRPVCTQGTIVYQDVIVERVEWLEVPADPDNDLATGTGRRFVVDHDLVRPRLRVLTDVLGVAQAFLELP
jgi:hypothetical protein